MLWFQIFLESLKPINYRAYGPGAIWILGAIYMFRLMIILVFVGFGFWLFY